jgi:hypothetical protein
MATAGRLPQRRLVNTARLPVYDAGGLARGRAVIYY